ncbi:alpha/beta fold hydrolase [Roseovarius aestuariivivens]|uniref:alpha/beta fold hydrolase n=1 Tax=Roseovarius aestuariivivens TaxID=1888910 RepID=UPI0010814985|nr:alpha/beta hydrolase [Roseovarius aestuariivivens]
MFLTLDQTFHFRGQRVAWGRMGAGDPVILIHGFPWSCQAWRRIAPWLAQSRTVYYFDMLGTGQSEKAPGQVVSEDVQSDLLAALVDHWGVERPQVVGHDFGGLAALRGHFVNGLDYGGLHLFDAVAVLPSGSPFFAHVRHHTDVFEGLPDYAHEALLKAYIQRAVAVPMRREVCEMYLEPYSGETGKAAFYAQASQADDGNIAELEPLFAKPDFEVHLGWGAQDSFIPVSRGERLRDAIGADSFTVIEDAAHMVLEDAPEAVLGLLMHNL